MSKKLTKHQKFYKEIKKIICSKVTYSLENIQEINKDVNDYIKTQIHFKKINKDIWNEEIFAFIVSEKILELIFQNVDILIRNKKIYPFNYSNFCCYIENKIHSIVLYKIPICTPEIFAKKFIEIKINDIKNFYNNYKTI